MSKKKYKHLHRNYNGDILKEEYSDDPTPTPPPYHDDDGAFFAAFIVSFLVLCGYGFFPALISFFVTLVIVEKLEEEKL